MLDRARDVIASGLVEGRPGIETVARELNLSVRTFQRRLAEAGWTYNRLLDDVRFAEARSAMARADDPLKAVAFDLGFVEQASFTRAFRRWTGLTPREYRRRLGPPCEGESLSQPAGARPMDTANL